MPGELVVTKTYYLDAETSCVSSVFIVRGYLRSVLFNLFVIMEPLIYSRVCRGTPINKNLKYTNYL